MSYFEYTSMFEPKPAQLVQPVSFGDALNIYFKVLEESRRVRCCSFRWNGGTVDELAERIEEYYGVKFDRQGTATILAKRKFQNFTMELQIVVTLIRYCGFADTFALCELF